MHSKLNWRKKGKSVFALCGTNIEERNKCCLKLLSNRKEPFGTLSHDSNSCAICLGDTTALLETRAQDKSWKLQKLVLYISSEFFSFVGTTTWLHTRTFPFYTYLFSWNSLSQSSTILYMPIVYSFHMYRSKQCYIR